MDNALVSRCVCEGILAGNEKLQGWTGGDSVCDRPNTEFVIVSGVADELHSSLSGWFVWPETSAKENFEFVGTRYADHVSDCNPVQVFGNVRYDLGLLRSRRNISGLVELKRSWQEDHKDLTKLAQTLYYLGCMPEDLQNCARSGVCLESVFFGAFVWYNPDPKDTCHNERLEAQFKRIKADVEDWWGSAKTGGGQQIQQAFQTKYSSCPKPALAFSSKSGTGERARWEMGAVCMRLSLCNAS